RRGGRPDVRGARTARRGPPGGDHGHPAAPRCPPVRSTPAAPAPPEGSSPTRGRAPPQPDAPPSGFGGCVDHGHSPPLVQRARPPGRSPLLDGDLVLPRLPACADSVGAYPRPQGRLSHPSALGHRSGRRAAADPLVVRPSLAT